jgi:hypothetical protein
MDFNGREFQNSKKNFQLIGDQPGSEVYMRFARQASHKFLMEVSHPFSIFQAFAVCLSTFDIRL